MKITFPVITTLQKLSWSVRTKIGMTFGLVLVCFVVDGLISALLLFNIKDTEDHLQSNTIDIAQIERLDLAYTSELQLYSNIIYITKGKLPPDQFEKIIIGEIKNPRTLNSSSQEQEFIGLLQQKYQAVFSNFTQINDDINVNEFGQAQIKWSLFRPEFDQLSNLLTQRRTQLMVEREFRQQQVNDTIWLSITLLSGLTLGSLLLTTFSIFLIERVLIKPLHLLQRALKKVASGDLNQNLEICNRDEIGNLAASFQSAVIALQKVIRGVQISETLSTVTDQLREVSQQQALGSNQQVSALIQMNAAMQELGLSAGNIETIALQVAELTSTTHQQIDLVAEAGLNSRARSQEMVTVVEFVIGSVAEVRQQVDNFSLQMVELNERCEAIGKVVNLVSGIASEVQLLALNVAIEAAGAGRQGMRFKELARQIKGLVNRANDSVGEIQSLVNIVQFSSRQTLTQVIEGQAQIRAVENSQNKIRNNLDKLEESATQVGLSVTHLLKLANQVAERAQEIKMATSQQRQSSEQVLETAHSVEEVARINASNSQYTANSSLELDSLSRQLANVLSQVTLS